MKKTLKIAAICVAMALVFAGCKAAPDDDKEDDKFTAPKVGDAEDLAKSGGTVPATETEALTLYQDSANAMSFFVKGKLDSDSSIRTSLATPFPKMASIGKSYDEDGNYEDEYPIDIEESVGGGTVKFTGNYKVKVTSNNDFDENNVKKNTTYSLYSMSEEASIDGTITNVTIEDDGENYTFNGLTKNKLDSSVKLALKTGSMDDFSDSKFTVGAAYAIAFGNAFSVKRVADGAGAKFVLTYAANYGPKTWTFGIDEQEEAGDAFGDNLKEYFLSQEATLSVYDDENKLKYTIKIKGTDALDTSILFSF